VHRHCAAEDNAPRAAELIPEEQNHSGQVGHRVRGREVPNREAPLLEDQSRTSDAASASGSERSGSKSQRAPTGNGSIRKRSRTSRPRTESRDGHGRRVQRRMEVPVSRRDAQLGQLSGQSTGVEDSGTSRTKSSQVGDSGFQDHDDRLRYAQVLTHHHHHDRPKHVSSADEQHCYHDRHQSPTLPSPRVSEAEQRSGWRGNAGPSAAVSSPFHPSRHSKHVGRGSSSVHSDATFPAMSGEGASR
jgi:hypothetical protein